MKAVNDPCDEHLVLDGSLTLAIELFDVQMLLDPFKEQLDGLA
ncbi:hypothetical protein J2S25_003936 [Mesobacillus stamsii]|uniref:Uncharacterized protein n=1 Tax=Mesobacillus stamsii TaxID=225347 RepID=A0ABU0G0N0_9BACI|nr:hypothetical protein [Mesobacillus stamsii]